MCFDLDGTLVDTERVQWQAYRRVLAGYGVDLDPTRTGGTSSRSRGRGWACGRQALPVDAATLRARKAGCTAI